MILCAENILLPAFPRNLQNSRVGDVVSEVALLPCHHHPSSSNRATALAMLEVVTPTCRAISAIDNPNSSRPRFAIIARRVLTFLRRLPSLSSLGLIRPFLHSSSMILVMVLPVRRSFSWHLVFSLASWRITCFAQFPLTNNSPFFIFTSPQSEFLVRQAKSEESSWLRSQPDKVSRPSEPSFASMQVTVWVKRKQGDSRP